MKQIVYLKCDIKKQNKIECLQELAKIQKLVEKWNKKIGGNKNERL